MNRNDSRRTLAVLADQRQRVRQREDDQVVLLVRGAQERAAVVDERRDARILVRVVGVVLARRSAGCWVDLDRVDVAGAVGQREGHVRAAAGAHDEHVLVRLVREPLVDLVVERLLRRRRRSGAPGAGCR